MPQIKIKRGSLTPSSLDDGELYLANGGDEKGKLYAGTSDGDTDTDKVRVRYSDESVYAQKIGTKTSQSQIGSDIKPIYVASDGTITESNGDVGGPDLPVYMVGGVLCDTNQYGGGTKVILNGENKGHDTASFFAPESSGSQNGQIVERFSEHGSIFARFKTDGVGSPRSPIYIENGVPLPIRRIYTPTDPNYSVIEDMVSDGTQPLYLEYYRPSGEDNIDVLGLKKAPSYAGGSRVRINSSHPSAYQANPIVYTPEGPGTAGYFLKSNGQGYAPSWTPMVTLRYQTSTNTETATGVNVGTKGGVYAVVVLYRDRFTTSFMVVDPALGDEFYGSDMFGSTLHATKDSDFDESGEMTFSSGINSGIYIKKIYKICDFDGVSVPT